MTEPDLLTPTPRHHYYEPAPDPPSPTDHNIRCHRCNKLLAEFASRPWSIRCLRCKAPNRGSEPGWSPP